MLHVKTFAPLNQKRRKQKQEVSSQDGLYEKEKKEVYRYIWGPSVAVGSAASGKKGVLIR